MQEDFRVPNKLIIIILITTLFLKSENLFTNIL